jgi:hypothetical protein
MGTLSPIGLATRLGEEDEDIHEEGNEAKKSKLAEKDAILTTEFKEAMSIYLITFFSQRPLITCKQIDEFKKNGLDKQDGEKESKPSRDPRQRKNWKNTHNHLGIPYCTSSWVLTKTTEKGDQGTR